MNRYFVGEVTSKLEKIDLANFFNVSKYNTPIDMLL